jgi:caffeoyl-CoA O-methyltransferase
MTVYNDQISAYISQLFARQDASHHQAKQSALDRGLPAINIQPEEGRFLQFLVRACGASKALEIGTLGGYSGIWIAGGLVDGGKLITVEREPLHARVARENFAFAGLSDQVEVRVGEASSLLAELAAEAPFDFIFIDAEKTGYKLYFAWAVENVRLGGIIAAHNAFRHGEIIQSGQVNEATRIMQDLNRQVASDTHLISTIFPAGDGTLVAVRIA